MSGSSFQPSASFCMTVAVTLSFQFSASFCMTVAVTPSLTCEPDWMYV